MGPWGGLPPGAEGALQVGAATSPPSAEQKPGPALGVMGTEPTEPRENGWHIISRFETVSGKTLEIWPTTAALPATGVAPLGTGKETTGVSAKRPMPLWEPEPENTPEAGPRDISSLGVWAFAPAAALLGPAGSPWGATVLLFPSMLGWAGGRYWCTGGILNHVAPEPFAPWALGLGCV